jgi:hypothetical protein
MELDGQLPKLNFTGMLGQQQNIFGLRPSLACRWLGFKKIEPALIRQAVVTIQGLSAVASAITNGYC